MRDQDLRRRAAVRLRYPVVSAIATPTGADSHVVAARPGPPTQTRPGAAGAPRRGSHATPLTISGGPGRQLKGRGFIGYPRVSCGYYAQFSSPCRS